MLKPFTRVNRPATKSSHYLSFSRTHQTLQYKPAKNSTHAHRLQNASVWEDEEIASQRRVKRNDLGVQLLSRALHRQIFKAVSFPPPPQSYIKISKEHLQMHGLDPTKGSILPDTSFQLPALQGANISEHFHRIGAKAAEPWLQIAKTFSSRRLPPKPDNWHIQSGWTKYHYSPDGASYSEHVEAPFEEEMLTFDVETMPNHHPYAVMACAASPNAWYAWISPWLLGESEDPEHLIPLGNPTTSRVIVGHNVAYDRIRIADEYDIKGNANRFIDTMALHIAVSGISSHQRPAWMKYRKAKETEENQREEAVEAVVGLMRTVQERRQEESDPAKRDELDRLYRAMEDSLVQLQTSSSSNGTVAEEAASEEDLSKRWEDITSANSLADVAKLHCGIELDKEIRSDFMTVEPGHILANITDYLDYCAGDVDVTHRVYAATLPAFLTACPHPVSFAGILTMGSSFLTVDENWEKYIENADAVWKEMGDKVQSKLKTLAEDAKALMDDEEKWKSDPWLSQLDWTPKVVGKSRGIGAVPVLEEEVQVVDDIDLKPAWYWQVLPNPLSPKIVERILPLLFRMSFNGKPLCYAKSEGWYTLEHGQIVPAKLTSGTSTKKVNKVLSKTAVKHFVSGALTADSRDTAVALCRGEQDDDLKRQIFSIAESYLNRSEKEREGDQWLSQLDWTLSSSETTKSKSKKAKTPKPAPVHWPKWYWELTKPKKDMAPGTLEITARSRTAPILLRLSWHGYPLVFSREHGWTFRVPVNSNFKTRSPIVNFYDPADSALAETVLSGRYVFYKVPHKDGDKANVATPLGKSFIKYAQDGTLKSPGNEAKEALDMNSLCSYWISARDRIINQLVLWQKPDRSLGLSAPAEGKKYGIILPQVITMGTVTRRAIEKTWLTASNAKKNRVGSELKAMIRAPEGYAIVGADVDSEELWISSCMGDAQFGLHGASAIGWMTLEGTKAAGTDLHSKTASILGISRDQAKVFNYSRIYGAGMRHAVLLLLQSNPSMSPEEAQRLAENLYTSTKGKNTHRNDIFDRKFWFGGTETYLFNKLEEIALSDKPQTPALGCGVTYALSKEYLPEGFGADYMPSRINWAVQSSGVDYLHLLIVSMSHLIEKYDIKARYLISVHDELRYLVKEEDKYRAALALQIANLWTRCLFAYKLGMDDLPQGVAFFSAVDIDHVLRKEVDMPCVTPSQPIPIPPGENLDITQVLERTNGGSLMKDGLPMPNESHLPYEGHLDGYVEPDCLTHRSKSAAWLKAQATTDFGEVKGLAQQVYGRHFTGSNAKPKPQRSRKKKAPLGNGEGFDWSKEAERILHTYGAPPY